MRLPPGVRNSCVKWSYKCLLSTVALGTGSYDCVLWVFMSHLRVPVCEIVTSLNSLMMESFHVFDSPKHRAPNSQVCLLLLCSCL